MEVSRSKPQRPVHLLAITTWRNLSKIVTPRYLPSSPSGAWQSSNCLSRSRKWTLAWGHAGDQRLQSFLHGKSQFLQRCLSHLSFETTFFTSNASILWLIPVPTPVRLPKRHCRATLTTSAPIHLAQGSSRPKRAKSQEEVKNRQIDLGWVIPTINPELFHTSLPSFA